MDTSIIDATIKLLIAHKEEALLILFLGSYFETIIGFSFFVFGEIFFLAGSILAGMGILNIWEVIAVLYIGGILGDSTSYYIGSRYGEGIYNRLKRVGYINHYINDKNYDRGVSFFKKKGAISVFFARLLGPLSWITPFIAGVYKLNYKTFLLYNIPGVIIGIGQFIIAGYFFGRHFDAILSLISTYVVWMFFIVTALIFLYFYLKKINFFNVLAKNYKENRMKIVLFLSKHFGISTIVLLFLYSTFLFYIFFIDKPEITKVASLHKTIPVNINDCKSLYVYYPPNNNKPEQQLNIILKTSLPLSKILDGDWVENKIFDINTIGFLEYIRLLKAKDAPVSSLSLDGYAQDFAYQLKSNSLSKREHIRFWASKEKSVNKYYGSISYDNGYDFNFYNYFYTPTHKINKNIDKSRDFFKHYLLSRSDLNVKCNNIQTNCKVKELKGDNESSDEQRYYTDGKILNCTILQSK